MELIQSVKAMEAHAEAMRKAGRRLGLVPTMGALHEAHFSLAREAQRYADHIIVSIFVNPTQFGPGEDYDLYPRIPMEDREKLLALGGVDILFAPAPEAMYPSGTAGHRVWVETEALDAHLCGPFRPGHFRGVTTIVAKLFNICRPHVAVFGLKDAQQFFILRRMVEDLNFDIEMVGMPIVRESDGLAMSSRNRFLSADARVQAVVLSEAVREAGRLIEGGEVHASTVADAMREKLRQASDGRIQYAELVDTDTLQLLDEIEPGTEVLAAVAMHFGDTRLIDNVIARAPN